MVNQLISIITICATLIDIIIGYQQMKMSKKIPKKHIVIGIIFISIFFGINSNMVLEDKSGGTNVFKVDGDNNNIANVIVGNDNRVEMKSKKYDELLECTIDSGWFTPTIALGEDYKLYNAMDDIGITLSNKNDISLRINEVIFSLQSFTPCILPVYDFERKLGADISFQWYYGEIGKDKGNYYLYYQGDEYSIRDKVKLEDSHHYLKVNANDIEVIKFAFDNTEPGIYEFNIQINYTMDGNHLIKTDTVSMYLPSSTGDEINTLYFDEFLTKRIYDYENESLPYIYVIALEEELKRLSSLENNQDINIPYDLEEFIASYYSAFDNDENILDFRVFAELFYEATNPAVFSDYDEVSESELIEYLKLFSIEKDLESFSWQKNKYDEYIIPYYSIKDINMYAHIEECTVYNNIYSFKGYVYNEQKGMKLFAGEAIYNGGDVIDFKIQFK